MRLHYLLATTAAIAAWVLPLGSAQADTVLMDNTGVLVGQTSFVQPLDITAPGTLTVSLANVPWLDTISGLSFFLSSASSVVGTTMGVGTESMNVSPGMVYAHWLGDANGAYHEGVYSLKIDFQPTGGAPVPIPASIILLLSGLGILFGWQSPRAIQLPRC